MTVTRTMELLIEEALKIIRNVSDKAGHVFVNKNQCESLARRFERVGEALKNGDTSLLDESAMDQIRLVLKKGETLVDDYKDRNKALANALSRAENQKSFKGIHGELDNFKTILSWSDDENVNEEVAAKNDKDAIIQDLEGLHLDGMSQVNVSNVRRVVADRLRQGDASNHLLS